ncbi:semaphorin-5B-like [Pecten maximus]|uniref:semaphorin-5B-like n=1 Tax=Pecten maximus TaxID=6579 RepID=UPI001458CAFF|nr:semaphorin-5B-like [Pecten maximus]
MLRIALLLLSTSLIPVLATEKCLCTESDTLLRTLPSPTAPVAGKLREGQCVKLSQFKRIGQWLQVKGDDVQSGYLFESDALKPKPCTDGILKRDDESNNCQSHCQYCCDRERATHHHIGCSSCGDHCCNSNGPVWSYWSHCSGSCGEGTHHRTCTHHCSSLSSQTQTETCHHLVSCPVWSDYGECSVSCGVGTQSRHCIHHCYGQQSHQTQQCHKPVCVQAAVDGHWSSWSNFGTCTTTCGSGKQIRTRTCSNPAPANGGRACDPDDNGDRETNIQWCSKQECLNDLQGSAHICNKLSTVQALAEMNTTNPSKCPDVWSSGSDRFLQDHCNGIIGTGQWKKGISVGFDMKGSKTIQPYTPIATFWNNVYQQDDTHEGFSGIFIAYTSTGFKMATKACNGVAEVMDIPGNTTISTNANFPNDPFNYFTVRW